MFGKGMLFKPISAYDQTGCWEMRLTWKFNSVLLERLLKGYETLRSSSVQEMHTKKEKTHSPKKRKEVERSEVSTRKYSFVLGMSSKI